MGGTLSYKYEDDSDDEHERRHSKSKLGAARFTSSPIGGPPTEHAIGAGLRRTSAFALSQNDSPLDNTRRRDSGFSDGRTFSEEHGNPAAEPWYGRRPEARRVPYFRYFGPTAIVPGFKQVVVSVNARRRRNTTASLSEASPAPALGPSAASFNDHRDGDVLFPDGLPTYDPGDPGPVPPLILGLIHTFFLHLGSNFPFLRHEKFYESVKEKRVEPILVDAVCALAARFSDSAVFSRGGGSVPRSEYGQFYAQRAKAATVDMFPCPSVGAVQAFLLMAYEGFGANQDSALWMYLGLAIRMAVDLGLQKVVGVKYQGEKDPWYTTQWSRPMTAGGGADDGNFDLEGAKTPAGSLSRSEQQEVEQGRIDTLWAVFILDRVISSGTGRPVTLRNDDLELALPEPAVDPATGWPDPYPHFVRIIHLYGRVSDVLNNVRNVRDLTDERWNKLAAMEAELTKQHHALNQRLDFNAANFRAYVTAGKATTFILLHFWFHALIIILHQPTLLAPFGGLGRSRQLLPNSRELSMSSAKTIADILAFAELIDSRSFIGNPFTSQPIYIAACAFLVETAVSASRPVSPAASPPETGTTQPRPHSEGVPSEARSSGTHHSLLASAASQNFQRCYGALAQMYRYWGGVGYILTALDQKSEGRWDVETYRFEVYGNTRPVPRRGSSMGRFPALEAPRSNALPVAWSLAGTTDSPSSNLPLMDQDMEGGMQRSAQAMHVRDMGETPQNVIIDPARQRAYQPTTSAIRQSQMPVQRNRRPTPTNARTPTKAMRGLEHLPPGDTITPPPSVDRTGNVHVGGMPYTPASHASGYEPVMQRASPPPHQHQEQHQDVERRGRPQFAGMGGGGGGGGGGYHRDMYAQDQDVISFVDGQEMDVGALGMQGEVMPEWMAYLPAMNMYDGMGS
ncbi:related to pathway-specific nitrogen regulator [Cephalotrichum gorgonifer]|uniref:Related to pathway-specific nitrogen regulator n=1 Tax=Cephalotrichum gorgonifer TaxID=2041049 RepID=A0AAE8MZI5_9PEZI|nr:related to pathway-specific nitrogen regulator [Cephalotrichum gorgonifer]